MALRCAAVCVGFLRAPLPFHSRAFPTVSHSARGGEDMDVRRDERQRCTFTVTFTFKSGCSYPALTLFLAHSIRDRQQQFIKWPDSILLLVVLFMADQTTRQNKRLLVTTYCIQHLQLSEFIQTLFFLFLQK